MQDASGLSSVSHVHAAHHEPSGPLRPLRRPSGRSLRALPLVQDESQFWVDNAAAGSAAAGLTFDFQIGHFINLCLATFDLTNYC